MNKPLKQLDEYNAERAAFYEALRNPPRKGNGIACPKCGAELFDSELNMTLSSNPPQKHVRCSVCEFLGYRVA